MAEARLIVIDDDPDICQVIRTVAEDMGFAVETADGSEALGRVYQEFPPTEVILDLVLQNENGLDILEYLKNQGCTARIILLSGLDSRMHDAAMRVGKVYGLDIVASVMKPFRLQTVRDALRPPETAGAE